MPLLCIWQEAYNPMFFSRGFPMRYGGLCNVKYRAMAIYTSPKVTNYYKCLVVL